MSFRVVLNRIEELRRQMENLAILKGSLTDPEVIMISQKLDKVLNYYDKRKTYYQLEQCANF